jgi:CubicO group peptidase (beta-lactamase class C family)/D-alanyl-D-alanine dipeptidase
MSKSRWAWLWLLGACAAPPSTSRLDPALVPVRDHLLPMLIRHQRELGVPGIGIAVLDVDPDSGVERWWIGGCGTLRPGGPPLDPEAVFRVASISKLYTATAAMVLVERGQLDLDAPVRRYLPEFVPHDPFGQPVTLRHLLGHRAGLVREPPVGNYFDASEPTLAATVASLRDTALVHPPGTARKYSNPGFGVVGELVARCTGSSFAAAVRELVLAPLQLHDSDFAPRPDLLAAAAGGVMWTYDGRAIPTPDFAFGYGPAADLRSTTADLCRFARSWLPTAKRRVLQPSTQAAMWQLAADEASGCGLGFFVAPFEGGSVVGHDGAVYGFASALRALPAAGIAVAVVCTKDFANALAESIASEALRAALAARRGEPLPPREFPVPVGAAAANRLAGRWNVPPHWIDLRVVGDELFYDPNIGVRTRLRRASDGSLVSDDVLSLGDRRLHEREDGSLSDGKEIYVRDTEPAAPPPAELLPLLGEYGADHNVLVVYEDRGRLGVLIEWLVRDLPDRLGPDEYVFPPGMYSGDRLRFERDAAGRVTAAVVGGARFARRELPAGGFRITPQRPIAELLAAAAAASPPASPPGMRAPELVDLATLSPTLRVDLRYTTADNFVGAPVYPPGARALLQAPAAQALLQAHRQLARRGLGLCILDAYRPWSVTKVFWEATPPALREFVADPAKGSRHNRGCAVDLTLYELASGRVVAMPSEFDEFTPRAYPLYPGGTTQQRWYRDQLWAAMTAAGFTVNESEWWHFDHADWPRYPIGNTPL